MINTILVVCVGNICRSPMAEALFKNSILAQNDYIFFSAGINALVGHKADNHAIQLMKQRGIDISEHRATQINNVMTRRSHIILVMELKHKIILENYDRSIKGRVFRLGEWGEFDISDPYREELIVFKSTLELIEVGVNQWIEKLNLK